MRPEILNPLFAALTDLKGVGPQLAKPLARLGLERVVDVLFHLPTGLISRVPVDRLDQAQAGQTIIVDLTAQDYRPGRSPRAPFGVEAFDAAGDHVRLVYFGRTSGLARKLFPLGETRRVSGRLDLYGDMRQIVHPDHVAEPGDEAGIAEHEPVYPLTEGLTNARLSQLAAVALERRPELA
ncbi:MAG: ATP-dependent DNA helicase RecG, partial [Sphingopyxis terrae]|nr:ATP-dependent DNA helicase RecG [Sphingopyxis terrae]